MWTCAVLFICLSVALASELELFDDNGWVPVSSDIVFDQIKRGITHAPRYTKFDEKRQNTDILSFISKHRVNEVESKYDNDEDNTDALKHEDPTIDIIKDKPFLQYEYTDSTNKLLSPADQDRKSHAVRRPKKLSNVDSHVVLNHILLPETDTTDKNSLKNDEKIFKKEIGNNIQTYEVTEAVSIEDDNQEESSLNENGYTYNRPTKQNFSTNLIKHLSKYNINVNDELQNYALSRRLKAGNPLYQNLLSKSPRFQVPIRYNSLNHLPVDPLLAVFLSNYGHYLQGQYGISNNYYNLYGYLASNNIHNNKPFGLYKLFSDTDSSNK